VQWAKAQIDRGKKAPIVVMADLPKEELDELVDTARAETGLDVMGRSGLPYSLNDLELVNAAKARTIIVMDPQHHVESDVCPLRSSLLVIVDTTTCHVLLRVLGFGVLKFAYAGSMIDRPDRGLSTRPYSPLMAQAPPVHGDASRAMHFARTHKALRMHASKS
jgi:hypothetical protein